MTYRCAREAPAGSHWILCEIFDGITVSRQGGRGLGESERLVGNILRILSGPSISPLRDDSSGVGIQLSMTLLLQTVFIVCECEGEVILRSSPGIRRADIARKFEGAREVLAFSKDLLTVLNENG